MTTPPVDFTIKELGERTIASPLQQRVGDDADRYFVDGDSRIYLDDHVAHDQARSPTLELAGPRKNLYFDPATTRIGIVTCGGLCPGLNDVIRGLVMQAWHRYGVRHVYGFRYGYRGFIPEHGHDVIELDPEAVSEIHETGGTILGSSRGEQNESQIVDRLQQMGINILFVIGGDGTIRGALAIAKEAERRSTKIAVVGIPKTIDNDIGYIDQSFGFETAYSEAVESIYGAHNEAKAALNGIGLVKLMGRESGSIACHATLATSHVNFTLIPESPYDADVEAGFLRALTQRLERRHHAVVVVAEGVGQSYLQQEEKQHDASGNLKFIDIGLHLKDRMAAHLNAAGMPHGIKYIDPSYLIRSVPARPPDSVYCWRLAQNAVHAAMCGKTEMVVGAWHGRMVHVPMTCAIAARKNVDILSDLWLSVLESTDQPVDFKD